MSSLFDLDFISADVTEDTEPAIVSQVSPVKHEVQSVRVEGATHLLSDGDWDWRQMRDCVFAHMEKIHGPQVRNSVKEKAIFESFIKRWGSKKAKIIVAEAFGDTYRGMWAGAPISVNRFCRSSDPFFGEVILNRLVD